MKNLKIHPPSNFYADVDAKPSLIRASLAPERQSSNSEALRAFLQEVEVLDWPSQAADLYGEVRAELRRRGKPIGANDLLIGCHALQLQRVLVTHNVREFDRIPGLKLEDWAQI